MRLYCRTFMASMVKDGRHMHLFDDLYKAIERRYEMQTAVEFFEDDSEV